MCGRYYIAEDDMDEMLAAYVAEALLLLIFHPIQ